MKPISKTTPATINNPSNKCPKCGINPNSGKPSCCVRGGAWFENCGDAGDSNSDHTWAEGLRACKGVTEKAQTQVLLPRFTIANQTRNNVEHQTHDSDINNVVSPVENVFNVHTDNSMCYDGIINLGVWMSTLITTLNM